MRLEKRIRVSKDGRIVIPKQLRQAAGIPERSYLAAMEIAEGTLLVYDVHISFDRLCEPIRQEAARIGFTREELDELIHKIRRERREASQRGETND